MGLRKKYKNLYNVWSAMKSRCQNPNNRDYKYYGGKGVKLCPTWQSFTPFMIWATKNGHKQGLTIDRKNGKGNYSPKNCRLVTQAVQCTNTAYNVFIEHEGKRQTISQWAKETGLSFTGIRTRLLKGLPVEMILKSTKKSLLKTNIL